MRVITWINSAFSSLHSGLQKAVTWGIALAIGIGLGGVIILLGPAYVKEQLGIATKEDVQEVTEAVRDHTDDELRSVIEWTARLVVQEAMDSAGVAQANLFREVSEDIIQPGFGRITALEGEVASLKRIVGQGNDLQRQQLDRTAEATDQIGELRRQLQEDNTLMNEVILDYLQRLEQQQDTPTEPPGQQRPTKPMKF